MKTFYTSCFARRRERWDNCWAISFNPPKYYPYGGKYYPYLAPDAEPFFAINAGRMDLDEYYGLYQEKLNKLDPAKVVQELPDGAIMLCHEKPGDPCHRHRVSEWLNRSGLCTVEEIYTEKDIKQLGLEAPNSISGFFY